MCYLFLEIRLSARVHIIFFSEGKIQPFSFTQGLEFRGHLHYRNYMHSLMYLYMYTASDTLSYFNYSTATIFNLNITCFGIGCLRHWLLRIPH